MTLDLNTNIDNQIAGFRLQRLEVLNWGTFNHDVWHIAPGGRNSLLTGDIGSGKSTLVDAITTLLVPSRTITYNKAAGAESRERSLRSYVRGAYKNEKVAGSAKARDVYLRTGLKHITVLIANFGNAGTGEVVALAQVLWMNGDTVNKFYVIAENALANNPDFTLAQDMVNGLKRRLRKRAGTEVFNSFTDYSNRFRQRFGIRQPEALELFYQTVSMKSVGNLTEFVRERMLGRTDIGDSIEGLVTSYADATAAHLAVQKARKQLEVLDPLMADDRSLEKVAAEITARQQLLTEVPRYLLRLRLHYHQQQLSRAQTDWQANLTRRGRLSHQLTDRQATRDNLRRALDGHSLQQRMLPLKLKIEELTRERDARRRQADRYAADLQELATVDRDADWPAPRTAEEFSVRRRAVEEALFVAEEQLRELSALEPRLHVQKADHHDRLQELDSELASLRERRSSIPRNNLVIRERLLRELQLEENELPFAGELLRVKENAADWEGAVERILHGLGLSLLVADRHYAAVSELVNRMHLKGKLVYLRTLGHRKSGDREPAADSLVRKVQIKGDTEHYEWLEAELHSRYDYDCCEDMDEFRRSRRGVTRQGQSKSSRLQHITDDRYDVNDRSRFVLGWSNESKIAALEKQRTKVAAELAAVVTQLNAHRKTERNWNARRDRLNRLLTYTDFTEMDYAESAGRLERKEAEKRELESQSSELRQLEQQLTEAERSVTQTQSEISELDKRTGGLENEVLRLADAMYRLLGELELPPPPLPAKPPLETVLTAYLALEISAAEPSAELAKLLPKAGPLDDPDRAQRTLIKLINEKLARRTGERTRLERSIERRMQAFKYEFHEEAREIDVDLRALPDYRKLHHQLVRDKLPEFENRFRQLLREGTIRGIVSFQARLNKFEGEIRDKIEQINKHLREIDYNKDTYITISSEPVRTEDISGFQQDLRAALSNTISEEEGYSEEKFQQVKKLLDRFRGATDEDRRWTERVTDVRQWYNFGAEERHREDDTIQEYFSDSSGKSGGQKEKLAYTILASAIAFQFGLQFRRSTDRSFRFVVIDEAFGRGSDESTRYGLRLFEELNLQLLIVTPLQKINVIEDHIQSVHYVSNEGGKRSMVRNIGIAEYRREKESRRAAENKAP
ncbi:MAG: ATP-binding protein [Saprospiraceae bacterium]